MNSAGWISHPALHVLGLFMDEFGGVDTHVLQVLRLFMDEIRRGGVRTPPYMFWIVYG